MTTEQQLRLAERALYQAQGHVAKEAARVNLRRLRLRAGQLSTEFKVALAFVKADAIAGLPVGDQEDNDDLNHAERAKLLVINGYVREPGDWDEEGDAIALVACERRGYDGDCEPPADYWNRWPELDGDLWWQWLNPAVGLVYGERVQ